MAKDGRLYGKFALDFPDSHKVMPLSDKAFRCLVEATLWSRKQLSDGLLPSRYAVARWGLEVLQELATNDPSNPSLIEVDGGWLIHDFAEHQDTKAEVEARSVRNKLAGQKGGQARAKRTAKRDASESVSESVAETETHTPTAKAVGGARKRATRLDPEWMPDRSLIDAMRSECPGVDLQAEHRKFVDYWIAKSGKDATKVDWSATWRNWIRRAAERSPSRPATANGRPMTAKEQKILAAEQLKDNPNPSVLGMGGPSLRAIQGGQL